MDPRLKYEILLSIYGRMQEEMVAIGLVDNKTGRVLKVKKKNINEEDGVKIYEHIFSQINHLSVEQVGEYAQKTNDILNILLNDKEAPINNYLLAMILYRNYLEEFANGYEKTLMEGKVRRSIELFESFTTQEYKDIRKNTARAADNIYRVFTGRLQLSDEVRDARFKRIIK